MVISDLPPHPGSRQRQAAGGRLSGRVYEELKDRLLEGGFEPGKRISMEALKTDFEVSKQPIMEAFRLLAADGLVEILPQIGCRPVRYTAEEAADFFRVFAGYEGAVAEAAALRRTPEQMAQLREISTETEGLDALPDADARAQAYRRGNRRFHQALQEMAHSRVMSAISQRRWDLSDYLVGSSETGGTFGHKTEQRHGEHQGILRALEEGDSVAARDLMAAHILHPVELLRSPEPE